MKNLREEVEFFLKGKSRLEVMLYLSLAEELQKERELKSIQNKTEAIGRELELEREYTNQRSE